MQSHLKCTHTILCLPLVLEVSFPGLSSWRPLMQLSGFHPVCTTGSLVLGTLVSLCSWDASLKIYSDFSFVQKISFIFNWGGLGLPFTRPLFVLSILAIQIFLGDGLMQFLLAQILNNWCAISSLAILCDDADALCTWKAVSELRAKIFL